MLVYKRKPTLIIDFVKHEDSIMERLLEITEKVSQLKEVVRRMIQKSQVELNRKFKGMKTQAFQKGIQYDILINQL